MFGVFLVSPGNHQARWSPALLGTAGHLPSSWEVGKEFLGLLCLCMQLFLYLLHRLYLNPRGFFCFYSLQFSPWSCRWGSKRERLCGTELGLNHPSHTNHTWENFSFTFKEWMSNFLSSQSYHYTLLVFLHVQQGHQLLQEAIKMCFWIRQTKKEKVSNCL